MVASQSDPRPSVQAMPRSGGVVIDGKLDDAAWAAARVISDFHQQVPDEGLAPTERTELRILYDGDALYVGARMYDTAGADGVRKLLARRDQLLDDGTTDKIALVLTRITTVRRASGSSSIRWESRATI